MVDNKTNMVMDGSRGSFWQNFLIRLGFHVEQSSEENAIPKRH